MIREELMQVMVYVYSEHDIKVSDERFQVWWDQFKDIPVETAMLAAKVLNSRKTFGAPKCHDFREALNEVTATKDDRETWGEGWDVFSTIALRFGFYQMEHILPAVAKQSPLAAAAMQTGVREFLTSQESDIPTIRAQFRQRYEALQGRYRSDRQMPFDVRLQLDATRSEGFTKIGDVLTTVLKTIEGDQK